MAKVSVDFLSYASVKRTIVVDVPDTGDAATKLAAARRLAAVEMAKDEDRNNAKGDWHVNYVSDPPFIDSAPRFVAPGIVSTKAGGKPAGLFG